MGIANPTSVFYTQAINGKYSYHISLQFSTLRKILGATSEYPATVV